MGSLIYGYIRVSAKDQNAARQLIAIKEYGISDKNIFIEKMSGKDFERPVYRKLIERLKPGDTLVVKSLDRIGRNYDAVLDEWRYLTRDLKVGIVVLDIPLLDTRQKKKDLTASFIADMVLQILSYISETERVFMKQRQAEGIAAAKARGVRFGRLPKERPALFSEYKNKWKNGEVSAREAGRVLGVSHTAFLAWVRED